MNDPRTPAHSVGVHTVLAPVYRATVLREVPIDDGWWEQHTYECRHDHKDRTHAEECADRLARHLLRTNGFPPAYATRTN